MNHIAGSLDLFDILVIRRIAFQSVTFLRLKYTFTSFSCLGKNQSALPLLNFLVLAVFILLK